MIEVYVTHYATEALPGYNDFAIHCAESILEATSEDGIDFRLLFLAWSDRESILDDLHRRMPEAVEIVRCENGNQPHLMNEATRHARQRGAEIFVCLHNDVRPARGWLRNLVSDLRDGHRKHGRDRVIASPRYLPFHWLDPSANAMSTPEIWDRISPEREAKVITVEAMRAFCKQHGFFFDGRHVHCPDRSSTTDDGHMLMMYGAAPEAFDDIGGCDESFTGLNYGDCDWGMRAIAAGKKNVTSQGCLIGHISGLTFFNPEVQRVLGYNDQRFIDKWGEPTFRAMISGEIWPRLRGKRP